MSRNKSIIPEFMSDNPDDTFKFLFPLKLKLDEDKFGNSHYEVVVKNLTKNEVFSYEVSPELLFTHFPLNKSFKNGKKVDTYPSKEVYEDRFTINSKYITKDEEQKLENILSKKQIGTLLGWNYRYINIAKNINCYLVDYEDGKLIIPHYAIGIYYYFRFSEMREAALECNIKDLYVMCDDNRADAKIVLSSPRTDENAAFIHRFACQKVASYEFDNIGKYILNYLSYMRRKDIDEEPGDIHLKINFPTKELFQIDANVTIFKDEKTGEKYYYIHEIINDNSDIGFDHFTKIIEQNKNITTIGDLEDLAKIDKEVPEETTEKLKVEHANKKYTKTQHHKDRKKSCGSLEFVEIDHESLTKDIIEDILKIYNEQETNNKVDQSLTASSSEGNVNTRRVVISSDFLEKENKPLNKIENFNVFRQYINFLRQQASIKELLILDVKDLPEFRIIKNGQEKVNPKCKIKKRARQYLSCSFKYESLYVGLLELENYPSSAASSWVIISDKPINNDIFEKFINLYTKDNISIPDIISEYKNTNPRFVKKNHERNKNLDEKQLARWYAGLLGKIKLTS